MVDGGTVMGNPPASAKNERGEIYTHRSSSLELTHRGWQHCSPSLTLFLSYFLCSTLLSLDGAFECKSDGRCEEVAASVIYARDQRRQRSVEGS
jgi:hypothetical protein